MIVANSSCRLVLLCAAVLGLSGSEASEQLPLLSPRVLWDDPTFSQGIKWLADRQQPEGHWKDDSPAKNDVGATALALLPFLGCGQTHKSAKDAVYRENVDRGLKFLVMKQGNDGSFDTSVRAHALATLTLCECYSITSDPAIKGPAQRGATRLAALQLADGGWNEKAQTAGDPLVTCWAVQALATAMFADLKVEKETVVRCRQFADAMQTDDIGSTYRRTKGGKTDPTATAALLLCRQFMGWGPRNPSIRKGAEYLLANSPGKQLNDLQYLHLVTRVLANLGGDEWTKWDPKAKNLLKEWMVSDGENRGSWLRTDGRLHATSLALFTFEIRVSFLLLFRLPNAQLEPN